MTKAIEFKGEIVKIVRASGKANAQMLVEFASAKSADMPLGNVIFTVEQAQAPLFPVTPKSTAATATGRSRNKQPA